MISKTALHTLKATVALAERSGEFQGAAHIAEQIGAPQNYLGKLLQGLVQTGIVFCRRVWAAGFAWRRSRRTSPSSTSWNRSIM